MNENAKNIFLQNINFQFFKTLKQFLRVYIAHNNMSYFVAFTYRTIAYIYLKYHSK